MPRLSIYLIGPFQVLFDGEPVTGFESDKVRALVAFLAAEPGRPHRREALVGLLWPDFPDSSARASLRQALANLRQAIHDRDPELPFLIATRQTIQLNPRADIWVDVTVFMGLMDRPLISERDIEQAEAAVALYRDDFLQGFCASKCAPFDEWMLIQQERLRRVALESLQRLAETFLESGQISRAACYAYRQIEMDPWREEAQRQVIRILALRGQRSAALAQYEACRLVLARELGVEPDAETTRLYQQILAGEVGHSPAHNQPVVQNSHPADITPARAASAPRSGNIIAWVGISILLAAILLGWLWLKAAGGSSSSSAGLVPFQRSGRLLYVCAEASAPQICVRDVSNGESSQLTSLDFSNINSPSWSPDGEKIIFSASWVTGSQTNFHHLYSMKSDGSDLSQISFEDEHDLFPAWSPDGGTIAFIRTGDLWLMHPDGTQPERIYVVEEKEWFHIAALAWSPDSQRIAFIVQAGGQSFEIWTIWLDSRLPKLVYAFESHLSCVLVAWNPAGTHIGSLCISPEEEAFIVVQSDSSGQPEVMPLQESWFSYYWPAWAEAQGSD